MSLIVLRVDTLINVFMGYILGFYRYKHNKANFAHWTFVVVELLRLKVQVPHVPSTQQISEEMTQTRKKTTKKTRQQQHFNVEQMKHFFVLRCNIYFVEVC